ncbi:hypothetical protein HPB49_010798 [Dermacentor silvarum]|uniref:Uncharacterized protein n=1 Tax=Dermacentor silvarum TaxID=543639 RepID=A0ACB8D4U3_DERSI|nr:hypothetical protein HPB49_010798 [Dermacentor silvarum]
MSIATSSAGKSLYSGPPTMAPPGKLYDQEVGGNGEQQLRQRRTSGAASPSDLGGAASPLELSGVASPASGSPADPGVSASPAPLRGIPITSPAHEQQEEKVVVALASAEMRRRVFETCIFVLSAAIILVFIGMLLFVLAFNEEITKAREVISYMNFSRDPCNEFYEYVCEGYLQEALTDRFKWTAPGLDNARLSKVVDGIYHRNVSDGPAVALPYDLNTYFDDSAYNLSADLVEAYKVIPLVHLVMTTAFPWDAERDYSVPTLETARLRPLMDTDYVTSQSAGRYMSHLIHDIWNGVTPNYKISRLEATELADAEAAIAQVRTPSSSAAFRVRVPPRHSPPRHRASKLSSAVSKLRNVTDATAILARSVSILGTSAKCEESNLRMDTTSTEHSSPAVTAHASAKRMTEPSNLPADVNAAPAAPKRFRSSQGLPPLPTHTPPVSPTTSWYKVVIKPRARYDMSTLPNRTIQAALDACL